MNANQKHKIVKPHYPIIYVRGYAMRHSDRQGVFHDAYYGFAETSVEKREVKPPEYHAVDIFEGQFIRFMKIKGYGYADAVNRGLEEFNGNPSRSLWISRFYDQDYLTTQNRSIEHHAKDLQKLICETIPTRLKQSGVDLGENDEDYKVILIAHSMGGLVCRTLLQNIMPKKKEDPKRWVHRLITIATPHRGIDLGNVPDVLEDAITANLNPFNSGMFKEKQMRKYLNLEQKKEEGKKAYKYELHSLGAHQDRFAFPVKRCLCIIGSDHDSYTLVGKVTGGHSDGLVKQSHAYLVTGEPPADPKQDYPDLQRAYWANVHRAHSGYRGIVNSYESFENIQRFLFGNVKVEMWLNDIQITTPQLENNEYFYDFEFSVSIRGTNVYLHRRQQEPCENAIRVTREEIPAQLYLHTGFLNRDLRLYPGDRHSHFALALRVVERRVEDNFLWDREYPARPIYTETLEIRVGDLNQDNQGDDVQYRWFSDAGQNWTSATRDGDGAFHFALPEATTLTATLTLKVAAWPDPNLTLD